MSVIHLDNIVRAALDQGAALIISISGGKDSQAMLLALVAAYNEHGWKGPIIAVHAHLGRAEWPQTMAHCHQMCADAGVPLEIVERTAGGDLVDRWKERMTKLHGTGKPFWSSAATRYCTSDMKRGPIDVLLRRYKLVVSAEGLRGDESPARAKKKICEMRMQITAKVLQGLSITNALQMRDDRQRLALTWRPILHWSEADVWKVIGTSIEELQKRQAMYREGCINLALDGWPAHPAYLFGNQRLSCALCVLASRNDLENGAKHNPNLWRELVEMERESGFTFRQDLALSELAA